MGRHVRPHLLAATAIAALVALGLVGCKSLELPDITGSTGNAAAPPAASNVPPQPEDAWRREAEIFGARYKADPKDVEAAIRYAQALRAIGQRAQAAAVLEQAALVNPKNKTLLGAFGRALADSGNYTQALAVLARAHSPDQPDWRILSVQGAVLDQLGRHEEARRYYMSALRIVPDEPSVLSNLALSYALSKNLTQAEATLRKAARRPDADPRIRQNLALIVGLRGRFDEAEQIARADLPPDEAAANVAYLRQMLAQPDGLKKLSRSGSTG
jgi:Flp pilus assembly protein TadD